MSTDKSLEQQLKDATVVRIAKHSDDPNDGATILFSNGMRIRLQGGMAFTDQNGEEFHLSAKAYNEVRWQISPEQLVKQMEESCHMLFEETSGDQFH